MDIQKTAFLFPGQGSQFVGMGNALAEQFPIARQTFEQADEWLGFELSRLAWEGPKDLLDDTINTQPALLTHSTAALRVLQELHPELQPYYVAGHSMGEISALIASGALPFKQSLMLARKRGELMKKAGEVSPGGMAAVLGLDIPELETICREASTTAEVVQVANDNCPGQVVISGNSVALQRAIELAKQQGARRVLPLAVSIAAHSPLMKHSQQQFNLAVKQSEITDPIIPLVGNVTGLPLKKSAEIRQDLQDQLTSRVRWTETIRWMKTQGIINFIEIGSGSVLTGLLKRIDPDLNGIAIGSPIDFDQIL